MASLSLNDAPYQNNNQIFNNQNNHNQNNHNNSRNHKLIIREQTSSVPCYEWYGNNRRYLLNDVVKNEPFKLELQLESNSIALDDAALSCELVYNDFSDDELSSVSVLRAVKLHDDAQPLTWKVENLTTHTVTLLVRIKALSSQFKNPKSPLQIDGHFRVRVQLRCGADVVRTISQAIRGKRCSVAYCRIESLPWRWCVSVWSVWWAILCCAVALPHNMRTRTHTYTHDAQNTHRRHTNSCTFFLYNKSQTLHFFFNHSKFVNVYIYMYISIQNNNGSNKFSTNVPFFAFRSK